METFSSLLNSRSIDLCATPNNNDDAVSAAMMTVNDYLRYTLAAGLMVWSIQVYCWYRKRVRRSKELPFPDIPYAVPNPHWLVGHIKLIGSDIVKGQRRLVVDYAGGDKLVSTGFILNTPTFTTLDAELMNRILMSSSERHGAARHVLHFRRMFGKQTILMQNGAMWRKSRGKIHRALQSYNPQHLQKLLLDASLRVEDCLRQEIQSNPSHQVLCIKALDLFRMAALDVMGLSCFAYDFGCTKHGRFQTVPLLENVTFLQQELTRRAFEQRLSLAAQLYWIPTKLNRQHAKARYQFRQTIKHIISQRRKQPVQSGDTLQFIDYIINHTDNEVNDDELADWLQTTMIGGFDTTAIALASTIYLLCKHPYYQEQCKREAQRVLGDSAKHGTSDFDATVDLPLITACFYEAVRLYPPATVTARNLVRPFEFTLDGKTVTLKENTRILCSFYWINRCEQNFPRPNEFLPTRWVQEKCCGIWEARSTKNEIGGDDVERVKTSFNLSFSTGARNCVGRSLAMRMAPTILATLLRGARFELADENYEIELERCGGNAVAIGGVPLRVFLDTAE